MGCGLLYPAFIVYQLTRLRKNAENPFLYPATIAVCSLGLIVRFLTLFLSWRVTKNFGKGLKEKVYGKSRTDDRKGGQGART